MFGYLGQGALILRHPEAVENPFFAMVPAGPPTYLLVLLSSAATVIASQALISGAFSLTRQAMLLGYSSAGDDQAHGVSHRRADLHPGGQRPARDRLHPARPDVSRVGELAAAYGIAVTGTMAITSILYYIVVRYSWGWSKWKAGALLALFLSFDIPFLVANLFKFFEGGYVPMLIGAALIAGMLIWSRGRTALMERYTRYSRPEARALDRALALLAGARQAVFLAPSADHVPRSSCTTSSAAARCTRRSCC